MQPTTNRYVWHDAIMQHEIATDIGDDDTMISSLMPT
jgi:hypothetical protein